MAKKAKKAKSKTKKAKKRVKAAPARKKKRVAAKKKSAAKKSAKKAKPKARAARKAAAPKAAAPKAAAPKAAAPKAAAPKAAAPKLPLQSRRHRGRFRHPRRACRLMVPSLRRRHRRAAAVRTAEVPLRNAHGELRGAGAPLLGVLPLSGTRACPGFRVFGRLARVRQAAHASGQVRPLAFRFKALRAPARWRASRPRAARRRSP